MAGPEWMAVADGYALVHAPSLQSPALAGLLLCKVLEISWLWPASLLVLCRLCMLHARVSLVETWRHLENQNGLVLVLHGGLLQVGRVLEPQ